MFSWRMIILRALLLIGGSLVMGLVHNYVFSHQGIKLGQSPLQAVSGLAEARFIDMSEAHAKWEADAIFIDARPEDFYIGEGHIKKAVSLPNQDFETAFARAERELPSKDHDLVIYCSGFGCEDSPELAKKLIGRGYGHVFVYEGGYPEWSDAGLPIEQSLPADELE